MTQFLVVRQNLFMGGTYPTGSVAGMYPEKQEAERVAARLRTDAVHYVVEPDEDGKFEELMKKPHWFSKPEKVEVGDQIGQDGNTGSLEFHVREDASVQVPPVDLEARPEQFQPLPPLERKEAEERTHATPYTDVTQLYGMARKIDTFDDPNFAKEQQAEHQGEDSPDYRPVMIDRDGEMQGEEEGIWMVGGRDPINVSTRLEFQPANAELTITADQMRAINRVILAVGKFQQKHGNLSSATVVVAAAQLEEAFRP